MVIPMGVFADDIERLKERIKELETALAEATPTPPVSPSNSSDLLSELNSCPTLLASGVDIEPLGDDKPRYKVVLTGPEDLMTRFFNELLRGRGKRT